MPGRLILFLGMLLCCASLAAQTPSASSLPSSSASKAKAKANLVEAELALDGAKRWTQAALEDDSNLQPVERDLLLVRLAASWKDADNAKAQEYFKIALDHFRMNIAPDASPSQRLMYSSVITSISNEVHRLDPKTWNELIDGLPKWETADTISRPAQQLIDTNDIKGAMELEKKSLDRGGSESDANTLEWMIQSDSSEAAKLFDQMLNTAAKPDSDPNLLFMLAQSAFSDREGDEVQTFFNGDRQDRLLGLVTQLLLSGKDAGGCNYSSLVAPLMSHFSPEVQGQLRTVAMNCFDGPSQVNFKSHATSEDASTDEIVRAMEEAPDARSKERWRELAIRHASEKDEDYLRALRLCLDVSETERDVVPSWSDRFEMWADENAQKGIRVAMRNEDDAQIQRVLNSLPSEMRIEVELKAIRTISKSNRLKAVRMLADARRILMDDASSHIDEQGCKLLMIDTAELSPEEMDGGWRAMVTCLNSLERVRRMKTKAMAPPIKPGPETEHLLSLIYPCFVPSAAMTDESLVRASTEDMESAEFREELRLGVIGTFLESYQTAIKAGQPGSAIVAADSKK